MPIIGQYKWVKKDTPVDEGWVKITDKNVGLIQGDNSKGVTQEHTHNGVYHRKITDIPILAGGLGSQIGLFYSGSDYDVTGTTNKSGNETEYNYGSGYDCDLWCYGIVEIEVERTAVSLNQDNNWIDRIKIINYDKLVNPKVLVSWQDIMMVSNISAGYITTQLNKNYQNNWIIQGDSVCQISADNVVHPITLKLANPGCEGRIGICAIEYQYGSENNGNNSCGGVEIRNIDGAGTYRLAGETTNIAIWRDTSVNPVRMFISPSGSTNFPSNIETWVTSTYQGWNYLTPKVNIGEVIKDTSNPNCTVTTCGFTSFLDKDCQCGKHLKKD